MEQQTLRGRVAAKPGSDLVSADVGGEVVILSPQTGKYYGLDGVGARIWELIQESADLDRIQEVITEEYDVDPEQFGRDLHELLDSLSGEGLIEVTNEPVA